MKPIIACCQILPSSSVSDSLSQAKSMVTEAALNGANIIILPEMFISPYILRNIPSLSESQNGPIYNELSALSKKQKIYLFAGSVPEKDGKNFFNTCYVFDPNGDCIGKYRKIHLFDVNLKHLHIQESAIISPGEQLSLVSTPYGLIGIAICFDLRFPEMFQTMAKAGAKAIVVPAAFSHTTGAMHWELLLQARAIDSQSYIFACSPALDTQSKYKVWGRSSIVDPNGQIISTIDEKQGIIYAPFSSTLVDKTRSEIPIFTSCL